VLSRAVQVTSTRYSIHCPFVTAFPPEVSVPAAGSVVIFTAANWLGGLSFGSVKPKSAAVNTYGESSARVTVLEVPTGAWLVVCASADGTAIPKNSAAAAHEKPLPDFLGQGRKGDNRLRRD